MNLICVFPEYSKPARGYRGCGTIVGYRAIWGNIIANQNFDIGQTTKTRAFHSIHTHWHHESMIGRKHKCWKRAGKRLEQHMPMFEFQTELY